MTTRLKNISQRVFLDEPYLHGPSLFQYFLGGDEYVQWMQWFTNFNTKQVPWTFSDRKTTNYRHTVITVWNLTGVLY